MNDEFVELARLFAPMKADEVVSAQQAESWGGRYFGAVGWGELLTSKRVVVLAEALSGKTEEFRARAREMRATHRFGFFAAVDHVSKAGFSTSLGREASLFHEWLASLAPAWFFLDSIDEARVNEEDFELALAKFAREVGPGLDRAHVFVSCRSGPLWGGKEDLAIVARHLPAPIESEAHDTDQRTALLAPFLEKQTATASSRRQEEEIKLMRLLELTPKMRRRYLQGKEVADVDRFEAELERRGLAPMAERPGDLNLLIEYWDEHHAFASLRAMMDFSVDRRLRERENRADVDHVADEKARAGAERLAAALTLCKATAIRSPREGMKAGAVLDPVDVLKDWKARERGALLSRGLFAPATFGALRFTHRSVQEYLTGCWLKTLMDAGASLSAIFDIALAAPHGVKTVPPSLRPALAWLAAELRPVREILLELEPAALLAHGDPSHLTLEEKQRLLREYARRDALGETSDHFIDQRSLWLFAEPGLADVVREVWPLNAGSEFRLLLVRLIQEAGLRRCADLLEEFALDTKNRGWQRVLAIETLAGFKSGAALRRIGASLLANPDAQSARFAPEAARALFPEFLDIEAVLILMARSAPAEPHQQEGFGPLLSDFFAACPSAKARERLMAGVTALCFEPPFADWPALSKRHRELARKLRPLARAAVIASDKDGCSEALLRLLLATSRAQHEDDDDNDAPSLGQKVSDRPKLKRRLMWTHAAYESERNAKTPTTIWQLHWPYYWRLGPEDETWLEEDLRKRPAENDRLVALSALVLVAREQDMLDAKRQHLGALVAGDVALDAQLASYYAPREPSGAEQRHLVWEADQKAKRSLREAKLDKVWTEIARRLQKTPGALCDPERLKAWPGPADLQRLTLWLTKATQTSNTRAPQYWRKLQPAFGQDVAQSYQAGMKHMWRITPPVAPKIEDDQSTILWTTILSLGGLALEAHDDPRWAEGLSPAEVERAAAHAVLSDQGCPDWLSQLNSAQAKLVEPHIIAQVMKEWGLAQGRYTPFLNACDHDFVLTSGLRAALIGLLRARAPRSIERLQDCHRLVLKLALSEEEKKALLPVMKRRFTPKLKQAAWDWAIHYAVLVMEFDVAEGRRALERFLAAVPPGEESQAWAERLFGAFFGRSRGSVQSIRQAPPAEKLELLTLAYTYIRTDDDVWKRSGSFDRRDEAQSARNQLLAWLTETRGTVAYDGMSAMAEAESGWRRIRFRQLAKRMAEQDAEAPPWSANEVRAFGQRTTAPAKTGAQLLEMVCGVLADIDLQFHSYDASSREVLETAKDEDAVQKWLFEQFELRAKGRYQPYREPEARKKKKPDIVITSAAAPVSVAVEAKHGGKDWTLKKLRRALRSQLADDYLKPPNRRHGVLAITHHAARYWIDKKDGRRVAFAELIERLHKDAAEITCNREGPIELRVHGIETSVHGLTETASGQAIATASVHARARTGRH